MSVENLENDKQRDLLRRYILGTATDSERAEVERRVADSPAWRDALEREREAIARLDALPDEAPSRDLTAAVLERTKHIAPGRDARPRIRLAAVAALLIFVIGASVIFLPALARSHEAARRVSALNTLKQWGVVFKMYAADHHDRYPPVTPYNGYWVPDLQVLYPNYISDPIMMVSYELPDAETLREELQDALEQDPIDWARATRIMAESFMYPGHAIFDEGDLDKIQIARATPEDGPELYMLREGVERFLITDINNPAAGQFTSANIPVMFENIVWAGSEDGPNGANVLYLDGHVEFIPYGQEFPVTAPVAETFQPPPR